MSFLSLHIHLDISAWPTILSRIRHYDRTAEARYYSRISKDSNNHFLIVN